MRAYVHIRSLTEEEYKQLKRLSASRKLTARRVNQAQLILSPIKAIGCRRLLSD